MAVDVPVLLPMKPALRKSAGQSATIVALAVSRF